MANLQADYSLAWMLIKNKIIPKNKIDVFIILTILSIVSEVKKGNRDELDIGDIFGLGLLHAEDNGYHFSSEVKDFLFLLCSYKDTPFDSENFDRRHTVPYVENKAKKLLKKSWPI